MADLKHEPTRHDHATFIKKAHSRKGFTEAYDPNAEPGEIPADMLEDAPVEGEAEA